MDLDRDITIEKIAPFLFIKEIFIRNISGVLQAKKERFLRKIFFKSGQLLDIVSDAKEESPGFFLLKRKILSDTQFEQYFAKMKSPSSLDHWEFLSKTFSISSEKINLYKTDFLEVFFGFLLFDVQQSVTFSSKELVLGSSTCWPLPLTLKKVFKKISPKTLETHLPKIELGCGILYTPISNDKLNTLDSDERGLINVIQNNTKLEDIFSSSLLNQKTIIEMIRLFYILGIVSIQTKEDLEKALWTKTLTPLQLGIREKIISTLSRWDQHTYYDLIEISQDTPPFEIPKKLQLWLEKYNAPSTEGLFLSFEKELYKKYLNLFIEAKDVLSSQVLRNQYHDQLLNNEKGSLKTRGQQPIAEVSPSLNSLEDFYQKLKYLNFYELLNLQTSAQHTQIRDAYRQQSKKFHPDLFKTNPDQDNKAQHVYKKIVHAYSVLKDPTKRKSYDLSLLNTAQTKAHPELPKTPNGQKFMHLGLNDLKTGQIQSALQNFILGLQMEPDCLFFKTQISKLQKK